MNSSSKNGKKLNDKAKLNVKKCRKKANFKNKNKNNTIAKENNPKYQKIIIK